jgi:hypothetical protein
MKELITIPLILVALGSAIAGDLPKMSIWNENKFLKNFPLGAVTKTQVLEHYGPPTSKVDDLPNDGEAWTCQASPTAKAFTLMFVGDVVDDAIVRYSTGQAPRTAKKLQDGSKKNIK